jgi:L,D-peptidoglycan transpeptidase YkuD (ErfK/YbiS/YcfS/YnhG family)
MAEITVIGNQLHFMGSIYRCAIGKSGFSANKQEGDGCTPLGIFSLRECWYRADRLDEPNTKLPLKVIHEDDGWCDDPKSPDYNRPVKLPYAYSHEVLSRQDRVYDLIIPLGYNDTKPIPGKGSAIFIHLARNDFRPTQGCVVLAKNDLLTLLPHFSPQTCVEIRQI